MFLHEFEESESLLQLTDILIKIRQRHGIPIDAEISAFILAHTTVILRTWIMVTLKPRQATGPPVGIYPHDMHPGLVPGIGVEDQRNAFGLDKITFFTTAVLVVSFII